MIQELSNKVWSNPRLHSTLSRIEIAWLHKELGLAASDELDRDIGFRAMQAAAILACSDNMEQRRVAYRLATYTFDLFGSDDQRFSQALRVVLTRLGNFPSLATRASVSEALVDLPWTLAAEEIQDSDRLTIEIDKKAFILTRFQHDLWSYLARRERVAISAPTSAGKTFVLQQYIVSLFRPRGDRAVVYIVPTRALIAQVARDLEVQFESFGQEAPLILTVPVDNENALPARVVYVMTQERVQLALSSHEDFRADFVVVDEAHSVGEGGRGVLLQWVIDDLLGRAPDAQIMFASPIVRNLDVFGRIFGMENVVECASIEPTVAQNFIIVEVDAAAKGRVSLSTVGDGSREPSPIGKLTVGQTLASRTDKLVHIGAAFGAGHSNIVYANGAAEAESIALQLADLLSDRASTPAQVALAELATESVHSKYVLAHCVLKGIGFHYSNIPTTLRRAIEEAFANGDLDYLVCTSTLLQGVNLPAKNLFMCAPEKGRTKPLESTDFWNLAGRAGRLRREFQGNIYLIDYSKWKKKPLSGPKSNEIVPAIEGSIRDKEDELIDIIRDDRFVVDRRDHADLARPIHETVDVCCSGL